MILPPWLVRNLTFPVYERLRSRRTLRQLADYQRLLKRSATEVEKITRDTLSEQLRFSGEKLPFYRQQFQQAPIELDPSDPAGFLRALPILTKDAVRNAGESMINRNVTGGTEKGYTGGTTGDRLQFWTSPTYGSQNMAARLFMQQQFGVQPGDSRAYLWGNPIETKHAGLKRCRDWLINEHLLDAFQMSPADMDAHLATLKRLRPRLLYGYPSALARLADHVSHHSRHAALSSLKLVVATGEMLSAEQRNRIQTAFNCRVAAEYGAREVGLIAHECPDGKLYIFTPIVHVEILNNGKPVEPGTPGEVVCTTVSNQAQPLIRYRLGDVGVLTGECSNGLPLPTMRLEAGKILGFIALPDGRLCNGAVTSHVLRDLPGIVHYRTHQKSLLQFSVWLQVDDEFEAGTRSLIQSRYERLFGAECTIEVNIVPELPPDPSGKRRYVVSDVAPDYTDMQLVDETELMARV